MSSNLGSELLNRRSQFLKHIEDDLNNTNTAITKTNTSIEKLKSVINSIQTLRLEVEHESLLPIGKRIYVPGILKHTGEYFLDHLAFPNSYSSVHTAEKCIELLESRIKLHQEVIEKYEKTTEQLEERLKLLKGEDLYNIDNDENADNKDLPNEIVSDRGVAVKVGGFYEILEFEND